MSTLPSSENRKQPPSIYTVMLILSMVFLLIAVIAMWIELRRWAPDYFRTRSAQPVVQLIESADWQQLA
ncbi:hypothetical protein FYK55_10715 [Roseiconus nitratireducens]|uniref:Uncharacterized protein n=1 Tax=Roseiconus nitratireducens TaxID=2605748 RepID=A0A5M6D7Y8_9BACT|nr:hypothetical protein [Roseiconus nitratireducens]KAA5543668.1 hypothetical protein FYK55_10715 [Roseiconus nitratireducens]